MSAPSHPRPRPLVCLEPLTPGAPPAATAALAAALTAASLPASDLLSASARFYRVHAQDGDGIGWVGLESEGPDRLLRSLVVDPARRNGGFGTAIVWAAVDRAAAEGARTLWLLTTGAAGFFDRFGFRRCPRDEAPEAIRASAQFTALCPASAVCMMLDLPSSPSPAAAETTPKAEPKP